MISAERLSSIACWSHDLDERAFERARNGIVERSYAKDSYICHRGDHLNAWTGVSSGLIKLGTTSISGKSVTLAGLRTGCWFGEGTVLKDEARQYDLMALRETKLAMMGRPTFMWLFENSVTFNSFLVQQLNERLGQFIALVEYDRMLDAPARLARNIGWLFNPVLYPDTTSCIEITQEELGLLSGLSRQATNKNLKVLEDMGLLSVMHGKLTVVDRKQLMNFGK
ncbi:MAG: Crp/Fnr family transcriptional regulator [Hyphomicrobiales bacterium]|nr:Crp/Fnr family transcriptional regulator [Hyphomicrobiales bacterium]